MGQLISQNFARFKKLAPIESLNERLLELKLKSFRPKITFCLSTNTFEVKTAETKEELKEVLRLRHQVFTKAYGIQLRFNDIDFDRYDLMGDHILLRDRSTNTTMGTYRVLPSSHTKEFYSQNEFTLDTFLKAPGIKVELGRACIHEDFRNGSSLSLIWKGLAKYINLAKADYMFGCTSVKTINAQVAMAIFKHYWNDHYSNPFRITPTPKYRYASYSGEDWQESEVEFESYIPSLFKTYVKAGAHISSLPALDQYFGCTDFFTVLDLNKIDPAYKRRYF